MKLERFAAGAALLSGILTAHTILNRRFLRKPLVEAPFVQDRVSVCVPARNEAANISSCLASILASSGVPDLEVLVLDDGSTDATAALVQNTAATDDRVTLLTGAASLPAGWIGKTNAAQQLLDRCVGAYVVFVDADVRLEPAAIRASVALLESARFDLVSPYPRQIAITPAERLMQPLLQWMWLTFLPLRLAERQRPVTMVAANGQFMVARRHALLGVDGFVRIRGEVLDDVALARAMKAAGFRVAVVDGTDLATCRMYDSWSALRNGYTKNLWSASGSPGGALALGALLATAYVVPPLTAIGGAVVGRRRLATYGALGSVAGVAGRIVSAQTTGGRTVDAVAHPLSISALLFLLARSWRHHRRGLITWKGRSL